MEIVLKRVSEDDQGTHGKLWLGSKFLCYTEELPWKDNEADVSCIPLGTYTCTKHDTPAHPNTWQVNDVPNRSNVLIHNGNTMADTEGCILVGMITTAKGVYSSVVALNYLRTVLEDTFTLTITKG